ncbi:MAG: Hpt domain-containing protein, partial [Potamolinea sp.]
MIIEDEELRNLYKISSEEHLLQLELGLRYLQVHPDDQETLEELRREAHSLKGDSRSVGCENVETLSHQVENILLRIKRQQIVFTPQLFERIYDGLKAISQLVKEAVTGQTSGVDTNRILSNLREVVSQPQEPQKEVLQEAEAELNVEIDSQVSTTLNPTAEINEKALKIAPNFIEDEELRNLYKFSSEEHLRQLEAGLRYIQANPDDEETLENLRREAHSLKGDSRSVGCENVETLSHQVEEILLRIKRQQIVLIPQLFERLYEGLDAIALLVKEAVTGQLSEVDTVRMLSHLMEAVSQPQEPEEEAILEFGNLEIVASTFIEDEELRTVYKITTQERLQKLEAGLLHLEKYPDDEATLAQLLREAHSLKGDSTSVGVENVEALIHQVEEIFLNIKRQPTVLTPQLFDVLYQGMDAISLLVKEAVTGQLTGVDTDRILNQLMGAVWETNIQESLAIPPETYSLSVKTPTQDLPSVSETYSIDTIRVPTSELDALMTQANELTVTKIS